MYNHTDRLLVAASRHLRWYQERALRLGDDAAYDVGDWFAEYASYGSDPEALLLAAHSLLMYASQAACSDGLRNRETTIDRLIGEIEVAYPRLVAQV